MRRRRARPMSIACRRRKHRSKTVVERGGAYIRVSVVEGSLRPRNDLLLDRPNLGDLSLTDLTKRDAVHKVPNLAAEYIRIEMTDDERRGLRIGPIQISRRGTYRVDARGTLPPLTRPLLTRVFADPDS